MKEQIKKITNVLMLVLILSGMFVQPMYSASEISSEVNMIQEEIEKIDIESGIESEVESEEQVTKIEPEEIIDITGLNESEIKEVLEETSEDKKLITDSIEVLKQSKAVSLKKIASPVNYSVINSSMYGQWDIYMANGHYIFCIQPGVDVRASANMTAQSGSIYSRFSAITRDYIGMIISSATQNYANSGNNDYIFAGQLLIWEYIGSHESSILGNPIAGNPIFNSSWTIRKASAYKAEITTIESEIKNWTVRPSFTGVVSDPAGHTLKYNQNTNDFSIILTDTNNVWDSKFATYGTFGNYVLSNPSGTNNVKITAKMENTSYTSGYTTVWAPYASGTAEFYDAGQNLVYVGSDPIKASFKVKTEIKPLGGFKVKKVDSETGKVLKGAQFTLYNAKGTKVKTYTTDAKGIISVGTTLPLGNYTLKEVKAPVGYMLNSAPKNITINANEITDYTSNPIKNPIIKGGFELTKVGEKYKQANEVLSGVEFTVTSSTYPKFKKIYTTDKNGKVKSSASELKYGNYTIEETKVSSQYIKNYKQKFSITENGVIVQLNNGNNILNELYMNRVHGVKMAQNLNNKDKELYSLEGAKFGIYKDVGIANGTIDRQDKLLDIQITDINGEFTSIELPEGSYYAKEIEAPEGYNINPETYPFKVVNDGKLEDGTVQDLGEITNEVISGTATLAKVGSRDCDKSISKPGEIKDCQTPLDNILFGIYSDSNKNGVFDKQEGRPVQVIKTDEKGLAITEPLKYGQYFVKEISNPRDNYFLNNSIFTFKIINQDEVIKINNGVAIENIEKLGKISISKTGESLNNIIDSNVGIAEAEYTIYDADNREIETVITNLEGIVNSKLLPFGKYTFKETKAPVGYTLDENIYEFTIDNESYQTPIRFDLTDDILTSNIVFTKVDSITGKHLEGAEFELLTKDDYGRYVNYNKEGTNLVTDVDGYIKLDNTPYGEYALKEIKAPNGYIINDKLIPFEVSEEGVTIELTFANTLIKLEKTGSIASKLLVILVALLFLMLIIKRKTRKELR